MKKTIVSSFVSVLAITLNAAFLISGAYAQTTPAIVIDGVDAMAYTISSSPYWLNAGQTLSAGNKVNAISVMQYNIAPAQSGGNALQFESVVKVTTIQTVPSGKAWKIESVAVDLSASVFGGDNLGNHLATTDLNMSSKKIINMANPASANDAVNATTLQKGSLIYAADVGAANAYLVTLSPAPTAYVAGMIVNFRAANANTGASSLNVNGLGAIPIKKQVSVDPITNDILAGMAVSVMYDAVNNVFQMLGLTGNSVPGVVPVANGGTGVTSLTPYAPIFGGTTSTSAVQSGTAGTAGQVLTSNGSGALPTFQAVPSSSFGGLGTDGDLVISSGTTTINLSGQAYFIKNYNSISITGTGQLAFSNPNSKGTIIILKSKQNVIITSTTNPAIDLRLIGGQGGTAGLVGQSGGNGALGTGAITTSSATYGGGGGVGTCNGPGSSTGYQLAFFSVPMSASKSIRLACGSGGGGGGGGITGVGTPGAGGAGGAGGGALYIECGKALNFTSTINASGQDGAAGGNATSTSATGAGGGGGGAGMVIILYTTLTANTGTVVNTGGNGGQRGTTPTTGQTNCPGSGGAGGSNALANGGAGGGTVNCTATNTYSGSTGGGGAGGGGDGIAGVDTGGNPCTFVPGTGGVSGGTVIAQNTEF